MLSKVLQRLLWGVGFLLVLFLVAYLVLQHAQVQNYLADKIMNRLSQQYQAEWTIGNLHVDFFDEVVAEDILFLDQRGDTLLMADELSVDIGLFSLLKRKIQIDDVILLEGYSHLSQDTSGLFNFNFLLPKSQAGASDEGSGGWSVGLDNISLKRIRVLYEDPGSTIQLGRTDIEVDVNRFDLANKAIDVHGLVLDNSSVRIETSNSSSKASEPFSLPLLDWRATIDKSSIEIQHYVQPTKQEIFEVGAIKANLTSISYEGDSLAFDINSLQAAHDSIALQTCTGRLGVAGSVLRIDQLDLQTAQDQLSIQRGQINLASLEAIAEQPQLSLSSHTLAMLKAFLPDNLQLVNENSLSASAGLLTVADNQYSTDAANIRYGTIIDFRGSGQFTPSTSFIQADINHLLVSLPAVERMLTQLEFPDYLSNFSELSIKGQIAGNMQSLDIERLQLQIDNDIELRVKGRVSNLRTKKPVAYDFFVLRLTADARRLPFLSNDLAVDSLGKITFTGSVAGTTNSLCLNGELDTELGKVVADMQLDNFLDSLSYNGVVTLDQFDLGTFLQTNSLGRLSLDLQLDGFGSAIDDLDGRVDGTIRSIDYKGYKYSDIELHAEINERLLVGELSIQDSNISLQYDGTILFGANKTLLDFTATIDTLLPGVIGLAPTEMHVKGVVQSSIHLPLSAGEKGFVRLANLQLSNGAKSYSEDSIILSAHKVNDTTFLTVKSQFLDLSGIGNFTLLQLTPSLRRLADYHLGYEIADSSATTAHNIHLKGTIHHIEPLDLWSAEQHISLGKAGFDLDLSFADQKVNGSAYADSIAIDGFDVLRGDLDLDTPQKLHIDFEARETKLNTVLPPNVVWNNTIDRGKISTDVQARGEDGRTKFAMAGLAEKLSDRWTVKMADTVIVNGIVWELDDGNLVTMLDSGILVDDLILKNSSQSICVQSNEVDGKGLSVMLDSVAISPWVELLTSKPPRMAGRLDGNFEVYDVIVDPYFLANFSLSDLSYDSTAVGEIIVSAEDISQSGKVSTEVRITGPINDVTGSGTYDPASDAIDFDLDIAAFELRLLDPFLTTIISDSRGLVSGKAILRGTLDQPAVNGSITLKNAITTIAATQSRYGIANHEVRFDNNTISLGMLDLYDENNNVATISGTISHSYLSDMYLDLRLQTDDFTFLNTSQSDNPVFFGRLRLAADGTVTGPPNLMQVDLSATTLETTAMSISPFSAERYLLQEDFLAYGKPSDFQDNSADYLLQLSRQYPFKVNLLLDANENAALTFVVDPLSGDKIRVKGSGDLRVELDPGGGQAIYGTYVVEEGDYSFSYGDFVSKDFTVQSGGTIRFNGNPLQAQMDVSAIYTAYTSTYELIKNEAILNDAEISAAQDRTDVEVLLGLSGKLTAPEIDLDIRIPKLPSGDLVNTVNRKLAELRANPSELNNQVFGLLLFNGFILSDQASSGFANVGSNLALSSISNLISSQLNQLAGNAIKGVDVNFNVNSYESSYANQGAGGTITEVGVEVSKQLFSDRLSITAGGNVDLNSSTGLNSYSNVIGDFVLEYKLTDDGRYRLRVFSKADYDRLLNENTNRNGVSLFFSRSFDSKIDEK